MAKETNHSVLLGQLAGQGGDIYIGIDAITDLKFSHIRIGNDGATLTEVKVNGTSVKTARKYPSVLPAGYLIIAGGKNYIDHIDLADGYAEGILFVEEN